MTYDKKTREQLPGRRYENWFYKTLVEKISVEFLLAFLQYKQKLALHINSVDQGGWRLMKAITITVRIFKK